MVNDSIRKNKNRALKLAIIIIPGIIGVLFIGYIIMLISITGSLERFGEPFWFEAVDCFLGHPVVAAMICVCTVVQQPIHIVGAPAKNGLMLMVMSSSWMTSQ